MLAPHTHVNNGMCVARQRTACASHASARERILPSRAGRGYPNTAGSGRL